VKKPSSYMALLTPLASGFPSGNPVLVEISEEHDSEWIGRRRGEAHDT